VKSYDGCFLVWSPFFLFWVCENWIIAKFTLRVWVFGSQRLELCTNLGGFFFCWFVFGWEGFPSTVVSRAALSLFVSLWSKATFQFFEEKVTHFWRFHTIFPVSKGILLQLWMESQTKLSGFSWSFFFFVW
jgi:hypothetical protein